MDRITSLKNTVLPAIIGLGVAWLGVRIIKNEKRLAKRKLELELQLGSKSLKGF